MLESILSCLGGTVNFDICYNTLNGVMPPKCSLDEYASAFGSHRRICAKLSIISFLYRARDSLRNNLKGSTLSSLFSSTMGGHYDRQGRSCKGSTTSSPNSLYPELVGYIHSEENKEHTTLIPVIQIYKWNKMKYICIENKYIEI
jgi:hypothetical protein